MRPLHIELEGLGSFRDRAELPLRDVDLFVLSGPTGAGKTTLLIDAMTLALYGTVPRYDDRRLIAPIISQSANEARVRLTFGVGPRTFTATRVVRRTKQGATTKEARLEEITGGGSTLLAGSADEVSAEVGRLLGLTFDQFCRSVILPQGAFDRFLFAKPAERADLLVQLLDLGVHDEVGRRARARAEAARHRADAAERRLQGDLAGADPMALPPLVRRIGQLQDLVGRCREVGVELAELRDRGAELRVTADRAAADRDALAALHRPGDVDDLAAVTRAAQDALTAAGARREASETRLARAEASRAELPAAGPLDAVSRARADLDAAEARVPAVLDAAEGAAVTAREAAAAAAAASDAVGRARAELEAAQRQELAHTLREGLHAGDACPVCTTTLTAEHVATDDLADTAGGSATAGARGRLEAAETAERAARDAHRRADAAATRAATERDAARGRVEEAAATLRTALEAVGLTDVAAVDGVREQVAAADAEVVAAQQDARRAADDERGARTALDTARSRERTGWETLDRVRDTVAALQPPSLDRDDLAAAWDQLLGWARTTAPDATTRADEAAAAVEQVADAWRTRSGALKQACADLDVELAGAEPLEAATAALGAATAQHDRLEERVVQVREQTEERDAARAQAGVADHLGKLLRADGFERWLLSRALGQLVAGASGLLRDLTSGGYSLALDPTNQFLVIDHRNADEPRTVKSLSGGERFLASLALALALADHVAQLAADGAARLESLFLDEGFGTLDPDTLDVVAAALEELGARGRVVGIVTHVRDLAERLPVRFEVRKGPGGSSVRRVDDGDGGAPTDDANVDTGDVAGPAADQDEEVA